MSQQELIDAIKGGDAARAAQLVDADRSLLDARVNGVSPILLAIYHGKADVARALADRATLSLHEAIALGERDRAMALIDEDSSRIDTLSDDGYPPVGLAIFFRQPELARLLIERGADVRAVGHNPQKVAPVHAAATTNDVANMRRLLERGADPNARQQRDYTPIHAAAHHGWVEMVDLLLEFGADPRAKTSDGKTAADLAREGGFGELAERLA